MQTLPAPDLRPPQPQRPSLTTRLQLVSDRCTQCQRCVDECKFLQQHGAPKSIAENYNSTSLDAHKLPFNCSLCGLCTAVCAQQIEVSAMFLEMRRESFDRGTANFPQHKALEKYEEKGASQRFSWYALPENCDTIFFPGCSLPGSRPQQTLKTFEMIQRQVPAAGIVLDCCSKPSHDLGRKDYFHAMFGEIKQFLRAHGIKKVLVACPNCDQIFSRYAAEFETRTVYEFLDAGTLPATSELSGTVNVHDPCVSRFSYKLHLAVRNLIEKKGLKIVESKHTGATTLCCGEGGGVGCFAPELAGSWTEKRICETNVKATVTYCAGCSSTLGKQMPTHHLLDLLFEPETTFANKGKVAKAPLTYWNRLRLKKHLQSNFTAAVTRERVCVPESNDKKGPFKMLLLIAVLAAACALFQGQLPPIF